MKLLRKKYLVRITVIAAIISLTNIIIQFDKILDFFPKEAISAFLQEEETESAEDTSKEKGKLTSDLILYSRYSFRLHNIFISKIQRVDLLQIPSNPFFEKITPPPQG